MFEIVYDDGRRLDGYTISSPCEPNGCFDVRFLVMFLFMFVHYTFSSVWVAEWPPFGKYLIAARSVSNLFSLYFVYL